MASFEIKELDTSAINGGVQYEKGDTLQPTAINNIIGGIAYLNANTYTKDNVGDLVQEVINALPRAEGSAF